MSKIKAIDIKINEDSNLFKITPQMLDNKKSEDKKILKKELRKEKKLAKIEAKKAKREPKLIINAYNPDINKGLTKEEVKDRITAGLTNKASTKSSKKFIFILFKNIFSFFNILMLLLVGLLIYAEASASQYLFLLAVGANLLIYLVQEIKAKIIIDKLSLKSKEKINVIRDGEDILIAPNDLVYNDIVMLKPGMEIPADLIMRSNYPVEVNESMLTGEADAILKKQKDILYSGSFVVSGTAYGQVCLIGEDTYIEKLSQAAKKYNRPKSQIIGSINFLIKILGVIVVILGGLLLYLSTRGVEWGSDKFKSSLISTVGALVGMIPAGLVVLTSMALAVGVVRLSLHKTLVQELSCIETLARVDTLCLDKTGTITDGTMSVSEVINLSENPPMPIDDIIGLIIKNMNINNATDRALDERFKTKLELTNVAKIPFDSKLKYQAVEFPKYGTFILGAPEFILGKKYFQVQDKAEKAYRAGSRVLLLAHTNEKIKEKTFSKTPETLALIILDDGIRDDAKETIEYFNEAGVEIKVISGDNPVTVSRIAQKVGIINAHKYVSLREMTEEEVKVAAEHYTVFGRVTPEQKKWLIQAFKALGKTVGMTGDGINDILALKEADTSIAMASGSEAARNVANMILMDSNFASMPKVVKEGRRVINNIKKVATIFLTKTVFSIMLTLITIIFQLIIGIGGSFNYPIQPSQLLLIDWFIVGIPSFFLALESNEAIVKKHKFLSEIIKSALPGAMAMIISIFVFYIFKKILRINDDRVASTLIMYGAISVFMFILVKICKPLNIPRAILVVGMMTAIIGSVIFIPEFFKLAPFISFGYATGKELTSIEKMLAIVIILSAYPIIAISSNTSSFLKKTKNNLTTKIRKSKHTHKNKEIKELKENQK